MIVLKKLMLATLLFFVFSNESKAQFQLKIPGGQMVGLARNADTLYFWGENIVWKSTDWGQTMIKWKELSSGNGSFHIDGSQGGQDRQSISYSNGGYFHNKYLISGVSYYNSTESVYVPILDKIFSTYESGNFQSIAGGMRVGPLQITTNIGYGTTYQYRFYEMNYLEIDGTEKQFNWNYINTDIYNNDSIPFFQLYNNKSFIGSYKNKIASLSSVDTSFKLTNFSGDLKLRDAEYQLISDSIVSISGNSSKYYLFNTRTSTIETKTHTVFPYLKKWISNNEIAYKSSDGITISNIFTGLSDTVINLPLGHQNMDFYFTGRDYFLFYDKNDESFRYTKDLGATWQTVSVIGMYTNKFQNMFNANGYIYASQGNKLYRVSCAQPEEIMEYMHPLPGYFNDNLQTTMSFNSKYSLDFGLTLQSYPLPFVFFDYEFSKIYAFGVTVGNPMRLLRSNDLGSSWDTISIPNDSYNDITNKPKGFAALGDTLILYDFKSIDGGLTWNPTNIDVSQYQFVDILEIEKNKITLNVRKISGEKGLVFHKFDGEILSESVSHLLNLGVSRLRHNGRLYYIQPYNSNPYTSYTLGNALPFGLENPLQFTSFNNLNYHRVALSDNYLNFDSKLYPLAQHLIQIQTCNINNVYNNQNYTIGDYVLTGDACQMDSVLRFSLNTLPKVILPKKYVCEGDTILFNGTLVTKSITLLDTLINSVGCDTILSQYFEHFIENHFQQKESCQGQTVTINSQNYQTDTTFLLNNYYSQDSTCIGSNWQKISFFPYNYDTLSVSTFCEGDFIMYNGTNYNNSTFVVNQNVNISNGKCNKTVKPLLAIPLTSDTLAPIIFCEDMPIVFNNQTYPNLTYVKVYQNSNTCRKEFRQMIQLSTPTTYITIDTFALDSLVLFGVVYYDSTMVLKTFNFINSTCDSLVLRYNINVSQGVATHEISNSKISISPNPAHNELNFQTDNLYPDLSLDLFDTYGKSRKSIKIYQKTTIIDVSDLGSGVYFWKFNFKGELLSGKILIQK
jgi:hypothetical protein